MCALALKFQNMYHIKKGKQTHRKYKIPLVSGFFCINGINWAKKLGKSEEYIP